MSSAKTSPSSRNEIQVTKAHPCEVCSKPDYCYTLSDGLIACKRTDYGSKLPDGLVWTKKTDKEGTYYIGTEESQKRWKESNKSQWQKKKQDDFEKYGKLINTQTWAYPVLVINEKGEYQVSANHTWYKTRRTYERGKKYPQYGYKKGVQGEEIYKEELTKAGEFIGLYSNLPIKLSDLLNESAYLQVLRTKYLIVLEGEKCVDCFNKESVVRFNSDTHISPYFLALTSVGGAGSVSEDDIQMYRKLAENSPETPIVLSPDFDKSGYQHIRIIYEALKDLPNPMYIVDWTKIPGLPDKKFDMADYFEKFKETLKTLTVEEFVESITVTPNGFDWDRFNNVDAKVSATNNKFKTLLTGLSLLDLDVDLDYLIDGLLPSGNSVVLTAKPKTGKTIFCLDMLACVATGEGFLSRNCTQQKVLYLNNDQSEKGFCLQAKDRWEDISDKLVYYQGWKANEEGISDLTEWCKDNPNSLIVLDSIRACICQPLGISQNDESTGYKIKEIIDEVSAFGCSIIFIHHDSKNKENSGTHKASGHSSITSMVDNIWHLDRDNQGNRKLKVLGGRLTDEVTIPYSLDDSGKCQPIAVNPNNDDEYEYREDSTKVADGLERKIRDLLTNADGGLTIREIMGFVGGSDTGIEKALKNIEGLRKERKGRAYVYSIEKPNLQLPTTNYPPIGETVGVGVGVAANATIEAISTDELKSSWRSVGVGVGDENGVSNATVQTQPVNEDVTTNTQLSLFEFPSETKTTKELSELENAVLDAFGMLPLKPHAEMTIKVKLAGIDPDKWDNISREDVTQALTNLAPDFLERIEDNWKLK